MKTLAIWYEAENKAKKDPIEIETHINFFKLKRNRSILRKYDYILELGFMIDDITKISRMNIHFPFDVKVEDLKDIGSLLSEKKLTNSIFNEYYNVSTNLPKQVSVKKMDGSVAFTIHEIDFDNEEKGKSRGDFTLCKKYGGTLLSLNIKNIPKQGGKSYIRFRLMINKRHDFIVNHKPSNWFLQSAFTTIEALDFRINEKRSYHNSLAVEISRAKEFKIKKILFFLIREATDDIALSSIPFSCREMEDVWSRYFEEDGQNYYNLEKMVIYRFTRKSKKKIDHFNFYVKIKVRKWTKLVVYIGIFVLVAVFSSFVYDSLIEPLVSRLKDVFPSHEVSIE